jgi:hypothetical protein
MKSSVNLELIFPVKDAPSASFMSFKASCLRDAGIITESEKQWVDAKVLSVLAGEMVAVRSGRIRLTALTASLCGSFQRPGLQHSARNQSHSSIRSPSKTRSMTRQKEAPTHWSLFRLFRA